MFKVFLEAAESKSSDPIRRVLPNMFEDALDASDKVRSGQKRSKIRIAADAVASLTEQQALDMHRRIAGYDARSVLDPIMR